MAIKAKTGASGFCNAFKSLFVSLTKACTSNHKHDQAVVVHTHAHAHAQAHTHTHTPGHSVICSQAVIR